MDEVRPGRSGSALRVALRRAAHQLYDTPCVFDDPCAVRLLSPGYAEALARTPRRADRPWSKALRAFAVARSCYAEQLLAQAVARGVRQYCLLGAGLDTFAWRNPHTQLAVWEADRPAMQGWKRALAEAGGLPLPERCTYVPVDLGEAGWPGRLAARGLRRDQPVWFAMLGVAPYLELETFRRILAEVRAHGPGSGLVFDYRLPRGALGEEEQRQHDSLAARVAAAGEPFRLGWTPPELRAEMHGFAWREDLDADALNARYFAGRADGLAVRGAAVRLVGALV